MLPAIVLSLAGIATQSRYLRSSMIETLRENYILTARAKGLTPTVVLYQHALIFFGQGSLLEADSAHSIKKGCIFMRNFLVLGVLLTTVPLLADETSNRLDGNETPYKTV